jgi:hypothetical protein
LQITKVIWQLLTLCSMSISLWTLENTKATLKYTKLHCNHTASLLINSLPPQFLSALDHVWSNVQRYYPSHTPAHKAAADMKELGLKHVSEISGLSAPQLCSQAQAASSQASAPTSTVNAAVSLQDIPSLAQMSTLGSADFPHSIFLSLLSPSSFQYNPDPSMFSYLMSQQAQVLPSSVSVPLTCASPLTFPLFCLTCFRI